MNINSINSSLAFCQRPLLSCTVKTNDDSNKKVPATLYVLDTRNFDDRSKVLESEAAYPISSHFLRSACLLNPSYDFLALENDRTGEIISCAQTSRKLFEGDPKRNGVNTVIEEIGENRNYVNPIAPVVAQIVNKAEYSGDKGILTAFRTDEAPIFRHLGFSKTKYNTWFLPEKRYSGLIDKVSKRNSISYDVADKSDSRLDVNV